MTDTPIQQGEPDPRIRVGGYYVIEYIPGNKFIVRILSVDRDTVSGRTNHVFEALYDDEYPRVKYPDNYDFVYEPEMFVAEIPEDRVQDYITEQRMRDLL